jgi:HlyD family secretion protein
MSRSKPWTLYGIIIGAFVVALLAAKYAVSYRNTAGDPIDIDDGPWTSTVKRGEMILDVRGTGTVVQSSKSRKATVKAEIRELMADELRPNQKTIVDTKRGFISGRVAAIAPLNGSGTRNVEVALRPTPQDLIQNLPVDVTVIIGQLKNVLYVGRPVHAEANSTSSVFRVTDNSEWAERVTVKFGRAGVNTIEVLDGLKEGDRIIWGEMSAWDGYDRIRLP